MTVGFWRAVASGAAVLAVAGLSSTLAFGVGAGVSAEQKQKEMEEEVTRAANAPKADLTKLQCGNLIYAGTKSSISFADKFLSDVAANTNLNVGKNFVPVRLEADNIFNFPFCVWSGGDSRKYHHGEFSHPFDYAKFWPVVAHGREPAVKAK